MLPYRTPPTPGYLGGFAWYASAAALIFSFAAMLAGTHYAAQNLTGIEDPLIVVRGFPVYPPWMCFVWGFRVAGVQDHALQMIAAQSQGIAVAGIVLSVFVFFGAQHFRIKRLTENAEDLHGSAKLASPKDIAATGLLKTKTGVYVGGWQQGSYLRYLRHNGPDHVFVFAPTRTGKNVSLIFPTLLAWQESVVVYDIKGENWDKSAGWRSGIGPVFRFAPIEQESARFNPIAEIRLKTDREVADAQNITLMLFQHLRNDREPHWHEAAGALVSGMVLYAAYRADEEGRVACLADVADLLTASDHSLMDTLRGMQSCPHPFIARAANEMLEREEPEFGSVASTARTAMKLFADPLVARHTSASDFRVRDLVDFERPASLYIVIPPSDIERLKPLVRLIFTVIVARLTEQHKQNRWRLLLMIDEFPSLGRMALFEAALSYMAGYGIKAYLIAQDIGQIIGAYGQHNSIVSNCNVRIAFAPNTVETARLLSEMTGRTTVQRASIGFTGSRWAATPSNLSQSVSLVERPLLTADEIQRLKAPEKRGEGQHERIVAPGQMLIFVAGHPPILGTQMLYFLDPDFLRRSQIAPPEQAQAIEGGQIVPQRALERTQRILSRPEVITDDDETGSAAAPPLAREVDTDWFA